MFLYIILKYIVCEEPLLSDNGISTLYNQIQRRKAFDKFKTNDLIRNKSLIPTHFYQSIEYEEVLE